MAGGNVGLVDTVGVDLTAAGESGALALANWESYAGMAFAALMAAAVLLAVRALLVTVRRWVYGRV